MGRLELSTVLNLGLFRHGGSIAGTCTDLPWEEVQSESLGDLSSVSRSNPNSLSSLGELT